ncbi:MAG: cell division protein FtsZ [Acidobacteria bacterium]|nr:cell division protein FtsZ [Acidobacteriota bacterium]
MQSGKLQFSEVAPRFTFDEDHQPPAKIKVIGIGGAGGNAVNRMIQSRIEGVEFISANTDQQALRNSLAQVKLQIGAKLTNGLGCGAIPERGRQAALEDTERIIEVLDGSDMVFVTCGMGGGTGTGAAPIVASLATELNALTVGVVTKPFNFEGKKRMMHAEEGIRELKEVVDTLITIPNERLLHAMGADALLEESFRYADDVLCQAVQGISDIITMPGIVNVDFADVKTIMAGKGMALMGTGTAEGHNRAVEAAQRAISSPLLEETSIRGAKGVLINITATRNSLRLHEVDAAAKIVEEVSNPEDTIFGAVYDDTMGDRIKITVIATGFSHGTGERAAGAGDMKRGPAGVVSLAHSAEPSPRVQEIDRRTADARPGSFREDLDEPAFRRRRCD